MISTSNIFLKISIFIAFFFSSINGASIYNISLNKICLLPLYIYLFFSFILNKNKFQKCNISVFFIITYYILGIISSLYSLTSTSVNVIGFVNKTILYTIQNFFIWIPIIVLLSLSIKKEFIFEYAKESLIFVCRINVIVCFFEFLSFIISGPLVTEFLLSIFFDSTISIPYIYIPGVGCFLRPSGLNLVPSYFGLILCLGFLFERTKNWKLLIFLASVLSMSRTSLTVITFVIIINYCLSSTFYNYKCISLKSARFLVIAFICFVFVLMLIIFNEHIYNQINALISRYKFSNEIKSDDLGTLRHLLYITKSLEVYIFYLDFFQQIFGFGPRASGVILTSSAVMAEQLKEPIFYTMWTVECDFSELLLGHGLLGFILYFVLFWYISKVDHQGKIFAIGFFIFSLLYEASTTTLLQLVIIIYLVCSRHKHLKTTRNKNA